MKKALGIGFVVMVLVGGPLAWHYHSPLPFLPPFGPQSPPPPADPLVPDESPTPGGESQDSQTMQPPDAEPPEGPSGANPGSAQESPATPAPAAGDEFTIEGTVSTDEPDQSTSAPMSPMGMPSEDLPPPLPVLAPRN